MYNVCRNRPPEPARSVRLTGSVRLYEVCALHWRDVKLRGAPAEHGASTLGDVQESKRPAAVRPRAQLSNDNEI